MTGWSLDALSPRRGPLHVLPALPKVLGALGLVVAAQFVPWIAGAVLVVLIIVSRVPPLFLARRLLVVSPFILGISLLAWFQEDGAQVFARLIVRSGLSLVALVLLASTTSITAVLAALRRMHVPPLLVTTLALAHRYLFVLDEEARRMRRARASRTWTTQGRREAWRSLSTVAARLFVRASERAERIYAAMCARGWRT